MSDHEPTELIYLPKPSWTPALFAGGLALLLAGPFIWFPYAVIGGVVALFALRGWLSSALKSVLRLPRKQHAATAPIPLTGVVREKRSEQA